MKSTEIKALFGQFEQAAFFYRDVECWSARKLQFLLGYSKWGNFSKVIDKAREACKNAGLEPQDQFPDVRNLIERGKGSQYQVDDILLTRYACYLIAQNGDTRKEEIAFAQTYFAIQTRVAELIERRLLDVERVDARAEYFARTWDCSRKFTACRGYSESGKAIKSRREKSIDN